MRIYLSPSNQNRNEYAYGDTNEMIVCNCIARSTEKYLKSVGFDVKRALQGQNMYTSIAESNAWGADLHICIHTNAGGGKGCEVYTFVGSAARNKWAEPIYKAIAAITPYSDRGLKTADFAELRLTNCAAVYCECEFHDNTELAKWIIEHTDRIGKAISDGVCEAAEISCMSSDNETLVKPDDKFEAYLLKVTVDDLNIRTGPGTNYTRTGKFTGKGVFTIVDEANGQGASLWGKLKSGAGWISLDYGEKV